MKKMHISPIILSKWKLLFQFGTAIATLLLNNISKVEGLLSSTNKVVPSRSFMPPSEHYLFPRQVQKPRPSLFSSALFEKSSDNGNDEKNNSDDSFSGEVGSGPNWIERSFPVAVGADEEGATAQLKKVEDYNLGISGVAFQTGPLSGRMYDAIISNNQFPDPLPDDIKQAYTMYAMDFTAKEATKAALNQNGLEMVLTEDEEDAGMWGDVDTIRLLDESTNLPIIGGQIYDSIEEAIVHWFPGQSFDFVVRQVPAKIRTLSLDELRDALETPDDGEFD
eukprot:CAMPEP_0195290232 /NCGR_PEP_ID=MMETSP0707-20130614/6179_1 /TAXON_ID=33640 /ORGANISM="Asterionellopsis glacialis, Strain CCMP134" /LENGTH=278 /DNA_ID=CAMNT_0040350333 /DNA_START=128 /DNA_END=964 /DNA_ORIENTATION=-